MCARETVRLILRARNVTNLSSRLSVPYPHLSLRPAQLSVMVSSNFYPQQRRKKKNVNKQRNEAAQTFPPAEKRTREKKIFPTPSAPPILARCRVKQKKGKKEKGKKKKRKESLSRIDKTSIRISLDRHGGKGVERKNITSATTYDTRYRQPNLILHRRKKRHPASSDETRDLRSCLQDQTCFHCWFYQQMRAVHSRGLQARCLSVTEALI